MAIDWVSWDRWLRSIGICDGIDWINHAIERSKSEANLDFGKASFIVDRCLRKSRATWPKSKPLEVLVTEAIARENGQQCK